MTGSILQRFWRVIDREDAGGDESERGKQAAEFGGRERRR